MLGCTRWGQPWDSVIASASVQISIGAWKWARTHYSSARSIDKWGTPQWPVGARHEESESYQRNTQVLWQVNTRWWCQELADSEVSQAAIENDILKWSVCVCVNITRAKKRSLISRDGSLSIAFVCWINYEFIMKQHNKSAHNRMSKKRLVFYSHRHFVAPAKTNN